MVSPFSVTLLDRLLYYLKPFVAGKQQTDLLMKSLLPRGYMYLDPQPGSVMDCHLPSRSVLVGECPCIFIPWKSLSTVFPTIVVCLVLILFTPTETEWEAN